MKKIKLKLAETAHRYEIEIGGGALRHCAEIALRRFAQKPKKIVVVSNRKVFNLYGETVKKSFERAGSEVFVFLMKDGERYKNFETLADALRFCAEKKLGRTDAIVALGGGVVGDLAGFAAAIYLRGIAFFQIPTTLLAMIDSSVGGKTAVNTAYGKNLIGAFYQPNGVLIDTETLKTLARRELTAGFCEAIKQGAIGDKDLFDRTANFLETFPLSRFKKHFEQEKFSLELENLIAAHIRFKAKIVMQDEKENAARTDAKSRKILNFGHTFAHALEKVTDYKRFKHGEAVGWGILFAARLAKKLDFFDEKELKLLNDVVHRAGTLPPLDNVSEKDIFEALAFDKKQVGDTLHWILLKKIGEPFIYQNKDISQTLLKTTLKEFLSGQKREKISSKQTLKNEQRNTKQKIGTRQRGR